jgi:diguanylate cyclase (GGDEF)-like protein
MGKLRGICRKMSGLFLLVMLLGNTAWAESDAISISYYDNYPLCFQDENGHPQGVFIDIMNEVADQEDWKLEYEYHTLKEQLALVAEGKVDLGMAVAYSDARAMQVRFHIETIYSNWGQIFVGVDEIAVDSLESLAKYRIALVRGDIYSIELEESFEFLGLEKNFVYVDGFTDVFKAIDEGKADAGAVARTFGLLNMDRYWVRATTLAIRPAKVKIIGAPGQENLLAGIDRWMLAVQEDPNSKYYNILSRWLREEVRDEVVPEWLFWVLAIVVVMGLLSLGFVYFLRKMVAKQTQELTYLAYHDSLTGLPNRRTMNRLIEENYLEEGYDFLLIDLDQFRSVNDLYGHEMGDQLLVEFTSRMEKILPNSAILSRLGGDEFTILLPRDQGELIANQLLEITKKPIEVDSENFEIEMSIGLAHLPEDGEDYDTLTQKAEMAMYQAKGKGNEKIQWFRVEMEEKLHQTHWYLKYMRGAIGRNEFYLVYQPIVDTYTQKRVGVEALLRWEHDGQLIPPSIFIPIAEQSGLIHEIGDWVVLEAISQMIAWRGQAKAPQFMSLNLSAMQLNHEGFIEHLDAMVDRLGADKSKIHFEVTENAEIEKIGHSRLALESLKRSGYHISLDDFGMGYSSMNYLKELPIDTMKIDRAFIMEIGRDCETEILIEELLILAKRLNLMTIAEGVETEEQWLFLKEHGCPMIQGYYFGRPVLPDELMRR